MHLPKRLATTTTLAQLILVSLELDVLTLQWFAMTTTLAPLILALMDNVNSFPLSALEMLAPILLV